MKPACPKCGRTIPVEHINMERWTMLCPGCGELFPLPTVTSPPEPIDITRLPRGISLAGTPGGFEAWASLHTPVVFLLIPVWAGGCTIGFYNIHTISGDFQWLATLLGILFSIGSLRVMMVCVLGLAGTTVVKVDHRGGLVSTGAGILRRRRWFDPREVVDVEYKPAHYNHSASAYIILAGERRIRIALPPGMERETAFFKLVRQHLLATRSL